MSFLPTLALILPRRYDRRMTDHLNILHVQPETMARLLASGRVQRLDDGTPVFPESDHTFPGAALQLSRAVTPNAAHRRVWSGYDRRFIFEFAGSV